MTFDYIVGNPPYNRGLHLEISSRIFEKISEDGEFIFIQPAAGFINNNDKPNQKYKDYRKMITENNIEYTQVDGTEFDGATFLADLAIIKIKHGDQKLLCKYKNGTVYDTTLEGVNSLGMRPDVFISISEKVKKYQGPRMLEQVRRKPGEEGVRISTIRGNVCQVTGYIMSNFYSFYSPPNYKINTQTSGYRIVPLKCSPQEVYDYLEYKTVQMFQATHKYSSQTFYHNVPFMPWLSEKELQKRLNFTKEEIEQIEKYIPEYSAQPQNNFGKLTTHLIKGK